MTGKQGPVPAAVGVPFLQYAPSVQVWGAVAPSGFEGSSQFVAGWATPPKQNVPGACQRLQCR